MKGVVNVEWHGQDYLHLKWHVVCWPPLLYTMRQPTQVLKVIEIPMDIMMKKK